VRSLTVEPIGGLANRMRVIAAGSVVAASARLPLHVNWVGDPSCNCGFSELFEVPDGVVVHELGLQKLINRLFHRAAPVWVRLAGGSYLGPKDIELMCSRKVDFSRFDVSGHLYMATCMDFVLDGARHVSMLVPTRSLQLQIERLTADFGKLVVGVHIRRTDNTMAQAGSPTCAFESMMRTELAQNPAVRFFVASDDLSEEANLRSLFPGKIVTHQKRSIDRNDPESVKDALIDLYCLSKTSKIIGSFWISFSEVAASMEDRELIIARECE